MFSYQSFEVFRLRLNIGRTVANVDDATNDISGLFAAWHGDPSYFQTACILKTNLDHWYGTYAATGKLTNLLL